MKNVVRIEREQGERGSQAMATRDPSPGLATCFDRGLVGFEERGAEPMGWLTTPGPTVTVILNAGDPFGGLPRAFVAGLTDEPSWVQLDGDTDCVDLKLNPLGAYRLLGLPMHEVSGGVFDLADVLGPDVERLCARIASTHEWGRRFDLVEDFLERQAKVGLQPSPEVVGAWARLVETDGRVRIGALASEAGWSHRHLIARFRREVGLTPKRMARILRFRALLSQLEAGPGTELADLAFEFGYSDQAHLHREFREFAATTPTAYLAGCAPEGVNFVQDGAATAD